MALPLTETKAPFSLLPCLSSFLKRMEHAKIVALPLHINVSAEFFPIAPYANNTRSVASRFFTVSKVFAGRSLTKVSPSVVCSYAIDVVNVLRPPALHDGESYTVREQSFARHPAHKISRIHGAVEGWLVRPCGVPSAPIGLIPKIAQRAWQPYQPAGFRIVGNAPAQIGNLGQSIFGHCASLPHDRIENKLDRLLLDRGDDR